MSTPDLDAIQNLSDDAMMHESLEPGSYAEIAWHSARDVPALLAYARDLEARIGRVEVLAEKWRYKGEFGWGAWQEGHGPDPEGYALDQASSEIRAALAASDTP